MLKHRNTLQKSLCPVVICAYLCSSDFPEAGSGPNLSWTRGACVKAFLLFAKHKSCLIIIVCSLLFVVRGACVNERACLRVDEGIRVCVCVRFCFGFGTSV